MAAAPGTGAPVERLPGYVPAGGGDCIFSWVHRAPEAAQRDCVAVLCPPIGHEYTHSHRTVRHLADRLARAGVPTLRFDYPGSGDSPGTDLDPDRLQTWKAGVLAAIDHATTVSGRSHVCLVGIRFGATLAALVAAEVRVDRLVLWNPCVNGERYLRELNAIAMASEQPSAPRADGGLECAGFVLTGQTVGSIRAVNLLQTAFSAGGRALVLGRDGQVAPPLCKVLADSGWPTDFFAVPGYEGMMEEAQNTVVPFEALDRMTAWVVANSEAWHAPATHVAPAAASTALDVDAGVAEAFCRFGRYGRLFGILGRAKAPKDLPAIVLFNSGAVHRVGPHRLHVALARHLAALGFPCLRFDLAGLGDSVREPPHRENHPYQAFATEDAREALSYLRDTFGFTRFILMGLCSGAHTSFHAALDAGSEDVRGVVLINPLTFHWQEGMSLDTSRHLWAVSHYRKSAADPEKWRKLLRGDADFANLARVGWRYVADTAGQKARSLAAVFLPRFGSKLSRDLQALLDGEKSLHFIISEGDPGYDILVAGAGRTVAKAQRAGRLSVNFIPGADHTFSRAASRDEFLRRLGALLVARYGAGPQPGPSASSG